MAQNKWWGYVHQNGTLHAKRFFAMTDITEAQSSPFVRRAVGPFMADDRDDALREVDERIPR